MVKSLKQEYIANTWYSEKKLQGQYFSHCQSALNIAEQDENDSWRILWTYIWLNGPKFHSLIKKETFSTCILAIRIFFNKNLCPIRPSEMVGYQCAFFSSPHADKNTKLFQTVKHSQCLIQHLTFQILSLQSDFL